MQEKSREKLISTLLKNCQSILVEYNLTFLVQALQNRGGRVLIVGGVIRDILLGIYIDHRHDIDLEVYGISFHEICQTLSDLNVPYCITGLSFGVIKLKTCNVDISSPRKDIKVNSGHKGFTVEYCHLLSFYDAFKRRDFTCNAMGFCTSDLVLVDEFDGLSDIENSLLRPVNSQYFLEDPLRFFRAARFASVLGFQVHESVFQILPEHFDTELPIERISAEFSKLICGRKICLGLKVLQKYFLSGKCGSNFFHILSKWILLDFNFHNRQEVIRSILETLVTCDFFTLLCLVFDKKKLIEFNLSDIAIAIGVQKKELRMHLCSISLEKLYKTSCSLILLSVAFAINCDIKDIEEVCGFLDPVELKMVKVFFDNYRLYCFHQFKIKGDICVREFYYQMFNIYFET